jgi:hypothetical protein
MLGEPTQRNRAKVWFKFPLVINLFGVNLCICMQRCMHVDRDIFTHGCMLWMHYIHVIDAWMCFQVLVWTLPHTCIYACRHTCDRMVQGQAIITDLSSFYICHRLTSIKSLAMRTCNTWRDATVTLYCYRLLHRHLTLMLEKRYRCWSEQKDVSCTSCN